MSTEPPGSETGSTPVLDWRDWVQIALERRWVVVTVIVVVMLLMAVKSYRTTPLYESRARIQIDQQAQQMLNVNDALTFSTSSKGMLYALVETFRSRPFMESVASTIDEELRTRLGVNTDADLVNVLVRSISIQSVPNSRMLDVGARLAEPSLTAPLANAFVDGILEHNLQQRMDRSLEAIDWLTEQAETCKRELEAAELAVLEYRQTTRTVDLDESRENLAGKLAAIQGTLLAKVTQKVKAESTLVNVQALMAQGEDVTAILPIMADARVNGLRSSILAKEREIALLARRYKAKHPSMVKATAQLEELNISFSNAVDEAFKDIKTRAEMAAIEEGELRAELKAQEAKAFDLDRKLIEYGSLTRAADICRQRYHSILAKINENSIAGRLQTNNIRIVDPAGPPGRPSNVNVKVDLLKGAIVGIILGLALAVAVHFGDDRIKQVSPDMTVGDIEVIGVIPSVPKDEATERAQIVMHATQSAAAEAFRALRTSLMLNPVSAGARRIMITSAAPAEGKSLIASNLASCFASNNERTLLLDADLRRPSVRKMFTMPDAGGLADVLESGASWQGLIRPTDIKLLDVMTAGKPPANPAELLGTLRMRDVLSEMDEVYDRIIIDAPPVLGVSDPLIMLPYVAGVLFVMHFNKSRRHEARHACKRLRSSGVPIFGAIMNNVTLDKPGYGYYKRYGYYQYGYKQSGPDEHTPHAKS